MYFSNFVACTVCLYANSEGNGYRDHFHSLRNCTDGFYSQAYWSPDNLGPAKANNDGIGIIMEFPRDSSIEMDGLFH